MKRQYNTGKKQVNFRLTEQARNQLEEMSKDAGISQADLVQLAVFELYHNEKEWATCPKCKQRSCLPMIIPLAHPFENTCPHCGNVHTIE